MELRIPSGTGLLDALLRDTTTPAGLVGGDAVVTGVTPAQLDDAIAGLERGDIEYLGLHHGAAFVQVAGAGAGPYLLEVNPGRVEDQVHVPGGVSGEAMRAAFHGFLVGDESWALALTWADAGLADERPPRAGADRGSDEADRVPTPAADEPTDAEVVARVAPPSDERWRRLQALPAWAGTGWDDDATTELILLLHGLGLVAPLDGNAGFPTDRYPNGRGLADAPPAEAVRLITAYVRGDRSDDRALHVALDDGSIAAALARISSRRP